MNKWLICIVHLMLTDQMYSTSISTFQMQMIYFSFCTSDGSHECVQAHERPYVDHWHRREQGTNTLFLEYVLFFFCFFHFTTFFQAIAIRIRLNYHLWHAKCVNSILNDICIHANSVNERKNGEMIPYATVLWKK